MNAFLRCISGKCLYIGSVAPISGTVYGKWMKTSFLVDRGKELFFILKVVQETHEVRSSMQVLHSICLLAFTKLLESLCTADVQSEIYPKGNQTI